MRRVGSYQVAQMVGGRYEVLACLGVGMEAETYKVRDSIGGRVVALKVLREDAPGGAEMSLSREFYHLSRFKHPGIVEAYDYGSTPEGRPYFTMEFFEGTPINVFFADGYRPELVGVTLQLLAALDRIHIQGLIHSDLKPQNILVARTTEPESDYKDTKTGKGPGSKREARTTGEAPSLKLQAASRNPKLGTGEVRAKLLDFGLAGRQSLSDAAVPRGTLGYVAPEVLKGVDVDARADLYSLGLVLYEVVTGRGPGKEKDLRAWLSQQYKTGFEAPREFDKNIPEEFESLVMSLVQNEPERRPASAAAVIEELSGREAAGRKTESEAASVVAPGFVGRGDELAVLDEMLANAGNGNACTACITGERGAGKSRLLSEFKFAAQLEGATILSFEPASLGARHRSLVEMALGYLRAYSPVEIPEADESRATTPEEKYRLFETVVQGLKALSASPQVPHCLALMVDDFEMYDAASREFLRYLVFSLGGERLMVLVAGVDEASLLDLIAELGHTGRLRHVQLPPMGRNDVAALLTALAGELQGGEVLTEWLMRTAGGSPLFVVETIRSLVEGKVLTRRDNRWTLHEDALAAYSPPGSVTDVLGRRLEILSAEELDVLAVGATAAGPFSFGLLHAVLKQDEALLSRAVAKLRTLGLLRSLVIGGESSFSLSSRILEAAVSERMSDKERRENHRRVALALEKLHPEKPDKLVFDLAHHYAQAGIEDRAFSNSLAAGALARRSGLSEQALGYYETALSFSAQAASTRERAELLERVGELREATGKYPEAVDAYKQGMAAIEADVELPNDRPLAARFLRKLGLAHQKQRHSEEALDSLNQALLAQPDRGAPSYIDTLINLGWSYIAKGGFARAETLLADALRLAGSLKERMPEDYNRLSARSYYHLGVLAWSRCDYVLAQQLVEQGLKHYEAIRDEHNAGEASHFLATLWWRRGDMERARECYLRYLPARRRAGDAYFVLHSLQGLGVISQDEGDWGRAHDYFADALNLAERVGDVRAMADLSSNLGTTCEERGDWDEALVFHRRAVELHRKVQADSYGRKVAMANLAQLLTRQGELAEAERVLAELQELSGQNPTPDLRFVLGDCRIRFLLRAGRFEQARGAIAETFLLVRRERDPRKPARLYTLASELRLATGNFTRAAEDARRALVRLGDHASSKEYAVALRLSGLAECMLDRADRGTLEIRRSIELLRRIGSKHELALSLLASAQALTKGGRDEMSVDLKIPLSFRPVAQEDVNEALANLKEAQTILRSIGARPDAERADELMETVTHVSATMRLKARGREEYLKVFYEISELIGLGLEKDDFFERILDSVIDVIKAERGLLFLMQNGKLIPAAARNVDHTTVEDATEISRSVLRKVKRPGETVFSADAMTDPRFNSANSVLLQKVRSLLCVPLSAENRVIGTIYVDSRVTAHLFLEEDMNLLVSVANLLAATIDKSAAFRKLQEEMSALREDILVDAATGYFMGRSKAMKEVYRVIDRIAPSNCTVLLTGETGTGKGVLARLIHAKSERRATRFMSINCGALPENLFESELFGHARGSFTGAVKDKVGLFEAATGGTVFLDEISNTTLGVQAKLLQVLDEKVIRRVGETDPRLVDVRLICATNRELRQEVAAGRFREDLFYRMNGVTIDVPALRERAGDVALLADYFVKRYATQLDKQVEGCEENVLEVFANYAWPGNIRELQNVIERSVIMAQKRRITTDDLGAQFAGIESKTESSSGKRPRFERQEVVEALRATGGNVSKAAEALSLHRRQIQRLITRYKIDRANPS